MRAHAGFGSGAAAALEYCTPAVPEGGFLTRAEVLQEPARLSPTMAGLAATRGRETEAFMIFGFKVRLTGCGWLHCMRRRLTQPLAGRP